MQDKILLTDESGEEIEFFVDAEFELDGQTYIILCENEDDEDALVYKLSGTDDDLILTEIEDDDEFERVVEFYDNSYEYDDEDEFDENE